jgi:ABC-type glycerol-3-phosphate transport system permease component
MLIPLAWALSISLKTSVEVFERPDSLVPLKLQFVNYLDVFRTIPYFRFFLNSLFVSILTIAGTFITASMAAFVFSRITFKGRNILFMIYVATLMIPKQVILIPSFIIMRNIGLLNNLWSLILTSTFTAYATFFLRQFFLTIPVDLEEAAVIDGLGYFKRLLLIIIPLAKASLIAILIITFLNTWNDFLYPLVFINNERSKTLTLGLSLLRGDIDVKWNIVMAASLLSTTPLFVLFVIAQRYFIEGIALSGLKV